MTLAEKHQLFQEHYPTLFAYAYRYMSFRIPTASDRDDVVSASIIQAYERLEQYEAERGNLQQWLTGILRRQVVDYWRHRQLYLELDETLLLFEAVGPRQQQQTIDEDLLFERIMETLSPEQRAMFALRYIDDLTYDEIAQVVHKESGAVRNFFSRLHRRLRSDHTLFQQHFSTLN